MKETERTCPVCLKKFPKNGHTTYCSNNCAEIAWRVLLTSNYTQIKKIRERKFQALVNYSQKHNIKKLVKKYMPKRRKAKVNENA